MKLNGGVPVNVNITLGKGEPAQTAPPPLVTAVGTAVMVTRILPAPTTVHPFESVTVTPARAKVVVTAGETVMAVPET